MHICLITGEYPPMEGGVGAFTRELAQAIRDLGHDLQIVTTFVDAGTSDPRADPVDEDGITVHRSIPSWHRRGVVQAVDIVHRSAPDVINLQYEIAAYGMKSWITLLPHILRKRTQVPLVVTFHDLLPPYLFPKAGPLRQELVWHLAGTSDGNIVTNAEDLRKLTARLSSRHAPIPMRQIPIGSNIRTEVAPNYDRTQYRARYGWGESDLVIGFFGFLNRSKGVSTLIRAVAHLRDHGQAAKLLFIGGRTGTSDPTNAAYAEEIDALIEDYHLTPHVYRTGFAAQQEISAALYAVDVCALPYREGANLRRGTLHAALAHGCAVVTTTPTPPVHELEDGTHVVFVAPEDPDGLAEALQAVGADTALQKRLGTAAAALAQQFTWPRIAAASAAFFESLI